MNPLSGDGMRLVAGFALRAIAMAVSVMILPAIVFGADDVPTKDSVPYQSISVLFVVGLLWYLVDIPVHWFKVRKKDAGYCAADLGRRPRRSVEIQGSDSMEIGPVESAVRKMPMVRTVTRIDEQALSVRPRRYSSRPVTITGFAGAGTTAGDCTLTVTGDTGWVVQRDRGRSMGHVVDIAAFLAQSAQSTRDQSTISP